MEKGVPQTNDSVRPGEVTRLLGALRSGDPTALDRILPLVYEDLGRLADRQLRREAGARSLQATELVHEAYVKLAAGSSLEASNRPHFLAVAAHAMRQVLVDRARRRRAEKRGGSWVRTTLGPAAGAVEHDADELLALDEALEHLESRQRKVVECRFFAGMEEEEIAEVLGVSPRTVRRDWVVARAALYRALYLRPDTTDPP